MSEQGKEPNPSGRVPEQQGSITPLGWKASSGAPVPVVQCTGTTKEGRRCRRWSLRGYTKCRRHAGPGALMKDGNVSKYSQAVIEAARLRLIDDSEKALEVLDQLLQPGSSEGIRLKAATEVLDRAGIRGGVELKVDAEITTNPSEEIASRLTKLAEGARAVEEMKRKLQNDADVVDGEVVAESDDEQDTLF